jgi:plasmid replication initiation protein
MADKHSSTNTMMIIETYKHNSIIGVGPVEGVIPSNRITLQDERYINICLGRVYKKKLLDKDKWYGIDVAYYAKQCSITLAQSYTDLREIASSLRKATVIIPQYDGASIEVGWVTAILFNEKDYTLAVQWNERVIPFISGFSRGHFTTLHETVAQLRSINAYRLYEIVKRESYKGSFIINYEELKEMLFVSYKLFGDFNAKLLVPCAREINEKTNLQFTFVPVKTGKKVTGIEFKIENGRGVK